MIMDDQQLTNFVANYKCHVMRGNANGRIILPLSALNTLMQLDCPMFFKLTNRKAKLSTHAGVLEFTAKEGMVYLPLWIMNNLCLKEDSIIRIEKVLLPKANFVKFQPQSVEFLDITNPKAVLEIALRSFACLSTGDIITISYNDKIYELKVLETAPAALCKDSLTSAAGAACSLTNAVSIIECDLNVDFAHPVDYQEHNKELPASTLPQAACAVLVKSNAAPAVLVKSNAAPTALVKPNASNIYTNLTSAAGNIYTSATHAACGSVEAAGTAFKGKGYRLDGKNVQTTDTATTVKYKKGTLNFIRKQ